MLGLVSQNLASVERGLRRGRRAREPAAGACHRISLAVLLQLSAVCCHLCRRSLLNCAPCERTGWVCCCVPERMERALTLGALIESSALDSRPMGHILGVSTRQRSGRCPREDVKSWLRERRFWSQGAQVLSGGSSPRSCSESTSPRPCVCSRAESSFKCRCKRNSLTNHASATS